MKFYVTFPPGLEEVVKQELQNCYKVKIEKAERGRVYFRGSEKLIPDLNYWGRYWERVVWLLHKDEVKDLEEIYKKVRSIDFSFIKPNQSFAIRSKRFGEHDFTSMDIARVAGQAVIDSYLSSKNKRLEVNLDEPDVIVRVELIDNLLLVGIDTTGDDGLHKRGYRIYQHPAPLNPVIAASMVKISSWKINETLVDPMCGSGTILVEAAFIGKNIPPGHLRDFAYKKLFDMEPTQKKIREVDLNLIGIEKFKKHVEGCKKIVKNLGLDIKIFQGEAERMHEYVENVDVIVTNPPYGLRIGRKYITKKLYKDFLKEAYNILPSHGRIVFITPMKRFMRKIANKIGYDINKEIKIEYGKLPASIFLLKC
ncbi:putative RNA methylase [Methanothermus fervidus DSM 2088]|uniref:Putative RNA methylase n=1 Tax=Methanothermus fervidus (strain ATCC 43054 / DSM 2088 / JCM 10308 / V24 S) TaxID=523846 RepID=E3GYS2_METFV|nr:tRNA (guanine(6)-N2)-methyltransferase [Methanothermus fervidus]ADP77454.1 putative RNA methylase [Methanothermus fervidus DSM 2088]